MFAGSPIHQNQRTFTRPGNPPAFDVLPLSNLVMNQLASVVIGATAKRAAIGYGGRFFWSNKFPYRELFWSYKTSRDILQLNAYPCLAMLTPKCATEALEMWMLWHDLVSTQRLPRNGLLLTTLSVTGGLCYEGQSTAVLVHCVSKETGSSMASPGRLCSRSGADQDT